MKTISELRELHRRALADLATAADAAGDEDLTRSTPCGDWDLAALLDHVTGQNDGFAAAAERPGEDVGTAVFGSRPHGGGELARSGARLEAAFAALPEDATVVMPEFGGASFPAPAVVGFQLLDSAVHAWDVATALGRPYRPDDEVVAAVLAIARQIPDDERRDGPGSPFARAVPAGTGDDWTETLALLGRTA